MADQLTIALFNELRQEVRENRTLIQRLEQELRHMSTTIGQRFDAVVSELQASHADLSAKLAAIAAAFSGAQPGDSISESQMSALEAVTGNIQADVTQADTIAASTQPASGSTDTTPTDSTPASGSVATPQTTP